MNVAQQRRDNTIDFVRAAMIGITAGIVEADAVLSVCPQAMVIADHKAQGVYTAIAELAKQREQINPVSVAEWLRTSDKYRDVTSADLGLFCEISSYAGREDAILKQAAIVRRESIKVLAAQELARMASECQRYGNDPVEIASGVARIAEALHDGVDMTDSSISAIMARVMDKLTAGRAAQPLATPWPALNVILRGGIAPGELAVLAARPGMGKTAMAGCLATEVAREGINVLMISREVTDETLAARIMAREGRVDGRYFREGIQDAPGILPRLQRAQEALNGLPLIIREKSIVGMTPAEVRRLAKSDHAGLIVVDYLQLMMPDERYHSREREVAEMSRSFKQLALDCNCPVLLLSQLNRNSETGNREPQLSDLRESGAIEQDADIVIFLHADKRFLQESKMAVKCIVAKSRSTGTGSMWLDFDKAFSDFRQGKQPQPEEKTQYFDNGL